MSTTTTTDAPVYERRESEPGWAQSLSRAELRSMLKGDNDHGIVVVGAQNLRRDAAVELAAMLDSAQGRKRLATAKVDGKGVVTYEAPAKPEPKAPRAKASAKAPAKAPAKPRAKASSAKAGTKPQARRSRKAQA